MNKLSVLVFSVAFIVISAFSTASATDLDAAWLEYENARNLMQESFRQLDEGWVVALSANTTVRDGISGFNNSWDLVQNSWVEIDAARAIVASTLNIYLSDSSERGIRPRLSGGIRAVSRDTVSTLPLTPPARALVGVDAPAGSYAALDQSWFILNGAWEAIDAGWVDLNKAWLSIGLKSDYLKGAWAAADAEWAKTNTAWAEINAAWASKQ